MPHRTTAILSSLVLTALLTAGFAGCNEQAADAAAGNQSEGDPIVFISVVSDEETNPQALDMAMKFAGFALEEKRRVVMFFNVKGVTVPTDDFASSFAFGDHEPVMTQLRDLIKRGADVHVCPVCMKALGVEEEDLIEGAKVTTRPGLFATLGDRTVVMTY